MSNNKKGFTLVELLAVMVILAIIALIAIPIINRIIDESRKGALKDSAYGLINSAELYYTSNIEKGLDNDLKFVCENNKCKSDKEMLNFKGNVKSGTVILKKDTKILICIDDGKNYAMKLADEIEITLGEGVCGDYQETENNFEIISDVELINEPRNIDEESDIKIISNEYVSQENKGRKSYASSYTTKTITNYIELPNKDSAVIYKFKVKNDSNRDIIIKNIIKEAYNNDNIKYEIIDFDINNDFISANSEKELNIKFSWDNYNADKTKLSSKLKFEFVKSNYEIKITSNYPKYTDIIETIDYKQTKIYSGIIPNGYSFSSVSCTNNQNGTVSSGILTISNVTSDTTCIINVASAENINYTNFSNENIYIVPKNGIYKIELWGSRGGSYSVYGGSSLYAKGAYTSGNIHLNSGDIFYINIGYTPATNNIYGGGASDVRLKGGTDFESLKSRIMVAAGAGSGGWNAVGGYGGALIGGPGEGSWNGGGATQTSGGTGGNGRTASIGKFGISGTGSGGGNGGNGYYGGGGGYGVVGTNHGAAGGGSSFISGYSGCNAIAELSTENNIVHTGNANHYSGYVFLNPVMIAGNASMPNFAGNGKMTGNSGNGYAKITIVNKD